MACDLAAPIEPVLTPKARPKQVAKPVAKPISKPVAKPTSQKSAELRSYLANVQSMQLRQEMLRRDSGGADAPFTADILARNFKQIAFFDEFDQNFSGRGSQTPLRRWQDPIRISTIFGSSVQPSVRQSDAVQIKNFAARLGVITGHPITTGADTPNFIVIVAGEDDRGAALQETVRQAPNLSLDRLRVFENIPRSTYCGVTMFEDLNRPNTFAAAVVLIRAENPSLLRLSCIHEEMAQGLGLTNDSPQARPSIFNDDDEFALLTKHDELLLQMLYDPRLRPGMSAAEAAPLTRILARELVDGPL